MKPFGLAFVLSFVLLGCGAIAQAQDFSQEGLAKAYPFKDLPGVGVMPETGKAEPEPVCSQELRMKSATYHDRFESGSDTSRIVYRCEKDGLTIESAQPPRRRQWNPMELR